MKIYNKYDACKRGWAVQIYNIKHFLFAIRYVQKQQAWWLLLYVGMILTQQICALMVFLNSTVQYILIVNIGA